MVNPIARWPYSRLAHLNAPAHIFRLGLRDSDRLERLEIDDVDFAHSIDLACPDIDRTGATASKRAARRRGLEFWPPLPHCCLWRSTACRRSPLRSVDLLPHQVEQHLGRVGDLRFRTAFDDDP